MTDELLKQANSLKHTIDDLGAQIQLIEDMHHCDNNLTLSCYDIGSVSIACDDELKDTILDVILNSLIQLKEAKEDEYRRL